MGFMLELYHHGILGQKWGKKNGPPYPLSSGQKSSAEKEKSESGKMASSSSDEKESKDPKTSGLADEINRFEYSDSEKKLFEKAKKIKDKNYKKYLEFQYEFLDSIKDQSVTSNIKDKETKKEVERRILKGGYEFEGIYEFTENSKEAGLGMALLVRRMPNEVGSQYFREYKGNNIKKVMADDDPPRKDILNAVLADLGFEQTAENRDLIDGYWYIY